MPQERISREDVTSMASITAGSISSPSSRRAPTAFLDRVDAAVEARAAERRPAPPIPGEGKGEQLVLSIISLATGIPITAIAAESGGVVGILVAWVGIVGVNIAFALRK